MNVTQAIEYHNGIHARFLKPEVKQERIRKISDPVT